MGNYEYVPDDSFEIRCEGFVSNSRLQSMYYSAADYYIQPSFLEAFAQTPMEAMACGTPVVSFPCSGAHDLITDKSGVVCDGFTSESLMRGIKSVMSQEYDREEIRKDLLERYSYEIIGEQYVKLYNGLM